MARETYYKGLTLKDLSIADLVALKERHSKSFHLDSSDINYLFSVDYPHLTYRHQIKVLGINPRYAAREIHLLKRKLYYQYDFKCAVDQEYNKRINEIRESLPSFTYENFKRSSKK